MDWTWPLWGAGFVAMVIWYFSLSPLVIHTLHPAVDSFFIVVTMAPAVLLSSCFIQNRKVAPPFTQSSGFKVIKQGLIPDKLMSIWDWSVALNCAPLFHCKQTSCMMTKTKNTHFIIVFFEWWKFVLGICPSKTWIQCTYISRHFGYVNCSHISVKIIHNTPWNFQNRYLTLQILLFCCASDFLQKRNPKKSWSLTCFDHFWESQQTLYKSPAVSVGDQAGGGVYISAKRHIYLFLWVFCASLGNSNGISQNCGLFTHTTEQDLTNAETKDKSINKDKEIETVCFFEMLSGKLF